MRRVIVETYEAIMNTMHKCMDKIKLFKRKLVKTRFLYGKCNSDKVFHVIKSDVGTMNFFHLF